MSCSSIAMKKSLKKPKHLVNWDEMHVDNEILEYIVAVAVQLYEANNHLE